MRLSPEDDAIVQQAIDRVVDRALALRLAGDMETVLANLMSVRDAVIGSTATLRTIESSTRSRAIKSLEKA